MVEGKYPWHTKNELQHYDDGFFVKYFKALEPIIPEGYVDPIWDEETKLLRSQTPANPTAGERNPNIQALYDFYEKEVAPKLAEKKTMVAMLTPTADGRMEINCCSSLITMFKPAHRYHTVQGHNIGVLRNMLVDIALKESDTTHLFFIDSDNVLPPYTLMRMLRRDLDIVAGVYTMKCPPYVPLAIKRPKNVTTGEKLYNYYFRVDERTLNHCVPCDGAGAGCLLVKREVFEKMGPPWFQVTPREHGLSAVGEDLFFFDKAQEHGYKTMLDLSVQCEHSVCGTMYPKVFYEGFAGVGLASAAMVTNWNKNAVLCSLNLPMNDPSPPPPAEEKAEVKPKSKKKKKKKSKSKKKKELNQR